MNDLKGFLDQKVEEYNQPGFINDDPISIPHQFRGKQDIEISGFFAATLAWGLRKTIIKKCNELFILMDNAPYDFIRNHQDHDLKKLEGFVHRTFNTTDLLYFVDFFKRHYTQSNSLESAFQNRNAPSMESRLSSFNEYFFDNEFAPARTQKHVATPSRNSACKRMNMFLRWMVRKDEKGVDFGIWDQIKPNDLVCPLDIHVSRTARKLRLIKRQQNDWKAAVELTERLKQFDSDDPVKYDFALFGLGVVEKF